MELIPVLRITSYATSTTIGRKYDRKIMKASKKFEVRKPTGQRDLSQELDLHRQLAPKSNAIPIDGGIFLTQKTSLSIVGNCRARLWVPVFPQVQASQNCTKSLIFVNAPILHNLCKTSWIDLGFSAYPLLDILDVFPWGSLFAKPVEKNVKSKTCRDLTARHGFETGLWVNTSMPRDLQRPLKLISASFTTCSSFIIHTALH